MATMGAGASWTQELALVLVLAREPPAAVTATVDRAVDRAHLPLSSRRGRTPGLRCRPMQVRCLAPVAAGVPTLMAVAATLTRRRPSTLA